MHFNLYSICLFAFETLNDQDDVCLAPPSMWPKRMLHSRGRLARFVRAASARRPICIRYAKSTSVPNGDARLPISRVRDSNARDSSSAAALVKSHPAPRLSSRTNALDFCSSSVWRRSNCAAPNQQVKRNGAETIKEVDCEKPSCMLHLERMAQVAWARLHVCLCSLFSPPSRGRVSAH